MVQAITPFALFVALSLTAAGALGQPPGEESTAPAQPVCLQEPVTIERAHSRPIERARLSLTHCDGRPNLEALLELSLLGRAGGTDRPPVESVGPAPGVLTLNPGLLTRLQAVADRFPDRAIEVVSGHRPRSRRSSRHHGGHALDIRVMDVDRLEVAQFARERLDATGVGYYPNSTFTHIDVREASYAWMDLSHPGQRSRYRAWAAPEQTPLATAATPTTPSAEAPVEATPTGTLPAEETSASITTPPSRPPAVINWEPPFETESAEGAGGVATLGAAD